MLRETKLKSLKSVQFIVSVIQTVVSLVWLLAAFSFIVGSFVGISFYSQCTAQCDGSEISI